MHLQRASSGGAISFRSSFPLTCGGEGCIYPLPQDASLLAKIYHQPNQERARKLASMVAYPLDDPMAADGHVSIAWPLDLLRDMDKRGQIVGFLMRRVTDMIPVVNFYNPGGRRQSCPLFNWRYLHQTARNLAAAFAAVHKRGDLVADVNCRNILVSQRALVTLVDTDSFQVRDPENGCIFRCPVGTAEYTPPELQDCDLATVDRNSQHDCFGLAIILFQLVMEGTHPFAGTFLGAGDAPPYEARIRAGHFPYSTKNHVPYRPMPVSPPFSILHPLLQHLFVRCFEEGHRDPAARPDAQAWRNALEEAEASLIACRTNQQHLYGKHLVSCPWCERTRQLGGRDPFPSVQVVRSGQHLQPRPQPHVRHRPPRSYAAPHVHKPPSPLAPRQPAFRLTQAVRFPHPSPAVTKWVGAVVAIGSGVACIFAQNWGQRTLVGLVALCAGCGWGAFMRRPAWARTAGGDYIAFLMVLIAGMSTPQIVPVSWEGLFQIGIGVSWLARLWKAWRLRIIAGYVIFALVALLSSAVLSPGDKPAEAQTQAQAETKAYPNVEDANTSKTIATLSGHSGIVEAVAWSPNGKSLASASLDKTVFLWDAQSRQPLKTINLGTYIYALAWSPDGKTLATGSWDGTIKLWDASGSESLATLNQSGGVTSLAWSPNGKTLASGAWDGTIRLWNAGRVLRATLEHAGEVTSLAWNPDGRLLANGSLDKTVRLWYVSDRSFLRNEADEISSTSTVSSLAWSPDGATLAIAGMDQTIRLWNIDKDQKAVSSGTLMRTSDVIRALAWRPNTRMLASASDDHTITLWDVDNQTPLRTLTGHTDRVESLAWSPDGGTLAIANNSTVMLWHVTP